MAGERNLLPPVSCPSTDYTRRISMKLRDVMTPNPRTLDPNATVQDAARLMRDEDTGVVPLVENGRPVGLITDRDIVVRAVAEGSSLDRPVRELATDDLVTAEPEMSTRDAAELMGEHQVRRLLVCEGEHDERDCRRQIGTPRLRRSRRLDPRLRGRLAASIADESLVGDLGAAVRAN